MAELSDKFLDQTVHLWQPRLGRSLNREDARQISANLVGFFQLLDEWDKAEQQTIGSIAGSVDFVDEPCTSAADATDSALPQDATSHKLDDTSNGTGGAAQ